MRAGNTTVRSAQPIAATPDPPGPQQVADSQPLSSPPHLPTSPPPQPPSPPHPLTPSPPQEQQGGLTSSATLARTDLFWRRLAEFVFLFAVLPLAFLWLASSVRMLIPTLMGIGLAAFAVLWLDKAFERPRLLRISAARRELPMIFVFGLIGAAGMFVGLLIFDPGTLFALPRTKPVLWAAIMLGYPLFSVYPQEIVYRAFLMHRYRPVFPGRWTMIAASAAAFGFGHIVLQNWLAVAMTFVGGALFAWRYDRSRSLAAVWAEHALWGCLIFTIGLGQYFYLGAVGR